MDCSIETYNENNLKISRTIAKYLDVVRQLKKLCNLMVKLIPDVVGALRTVSRGLKKETGGI